MSGRSKSAHPPGKIRIVAGTRRGHKIIVPETEKLRPTGERVREAIFDALGPINGLRVLDLFAGTGAMGLEALSRGAAGCIFVESDRVALAALRQNIELLDFESTSQVLGVDYKFALHRLASEGEAFDLLFADPPYRMLSEVEAALQPFLSRLLVENGVLVVEGPKSSEAPLSRPAVFDRVYGDTRVTMISMGSDDQ